MKKIVVVLCDFNVEIVEGIIFLYVVVYVGEVEFVK